MKILDIFLDCVLIPLSFVIPKKKNTALLGSGDGISFKGNTKYVFLYLLKHRREIKSFWITHNKKLFEELGSRNLPVVYKYSLGGFMKILTSEYHIIEIMPRDIIYAGYWAVGRFNYIQTFHGTPLKRIANDANEDMLGIAASDFMNIRIIGRILSKIKAAFKRNFLYRRYALVVSSCDECGGIYKKAFLNDNVETLGFARNDIFFKQELIYNDFRGRLEINNYKKIISYIPTFRDTPTATEPFPLHFIGKLNDYLRGNNYLLLIKKHPYDRNLKIDSDYSNIMDVSSVVDDVMELLVFTDILITDYSSVFFDFILTDRPVIYYSYDLGEYLQSCRGMYYDYARDIPGPFAQDCDELYRLITRVDEWFFSEKYREKYLSFKARFNKYWDGDSGERLVNHIFRGKL